MFLKEEKEYKITGLQSRPVTTVNLNETYNQNRNSVWYKKNIYHLAIILAKYLSW